MAHTWDDEYNGRSWKFCSVCEVRMACPFFMPMSKLENGAWPHPGRLPLGYGWSGHCTAPGHEGEVPPREALEEFCNLGYAESCGRLPRERAWDAVRFAVSVEPPMASGPRSQASDGGVIPKRIIQVEYVCELQHRPKDHGKLEFDGEAMQWVRGHADSRVQKMAECFLEAYLVKRKLQVLNATSSG